jgi:hypothetical protein
MKCLLEKPSASIARCKEVVPVLDKPMPNIFELKEYELDYCKGKKIEIWAVLSIPTKK